MSLPLLATLDARIRLRAERTQADHPYWPCKDGCDHCCRSLPSLPNVTRAEWERLSDAICALPSEIYLEVERALWAEHPTPPVTCPLLDREKGSCRVYEARPLACRTYGFYTEWDAGLHCEKVSRAIEQAGTGEHVVWGNGEAIASDMRPLGETKTLDAWFKEPQEPAAPSRTAGESRSEAPGETT